jgi:hypothetical protein
MAAGERGRARQEEIKGFPLKSSHNPSIMNQFPFIISLLTFSVSAEAPKPYEQRRTINVSRGGFPTRPGLRLGLESLRSVVLAHTMTPWFKSTCAWTARLMTDLLTGAISEVKMKEGCDRM